MAEASTRNREAPPQQQTRRFNGDPFTAFSDNLLGAVLLRVACNGVRFGGHDCPVSDDEEADAEKKIDEALIEPLPSESAWLAGNPEAPVRCSSSLVSFRHALVCKRWLRVARLVHPAIVVPLNRFFSARALASLLRAPATAGFPNLRHLHLAPNALDTVDPALCAICVGSGPSLTHLTLQLHDGWLPVTRARQYSFRGIGAQAAAVAEAALSAGAVSPADVAALFCSCTRLVSLDVNFGKGLSEVPAAVSCLQQLTNFGMSFDDDVTTLPAEFGSLVRLKRLQIRSSSLVLPDSFCGLPALKHVSLRGCDFSHLPSDLGQLRNLKNLTFKLLMQLVELPASTCLLSALTSLTLVHCYALAKLPENFHQLANLRTIHLEALIALAALPQSFGQLPALRDLTIEGNGRITHLPPSLSSSRTLERISLNDCQALLSLPDAIGRIPTLERVDLIFLDALTALPDSLGCASRLHELSIVKCRRLVALPRLVSALTSLTRLTLDDCAVWALPEDFGQLSNLAQLKLCCGHLPALPRSFGQLGKLQELRLHACYGLLELPAFFANLSSLETLVIYGGTSLISLPPCFEQLPQLRCLELFNCAIPNLPERFGQLPKLEVLKVGSRESYTRDGADPEQRSSTACPTALSLATLNEPLLGRCLLRSLPPSLSSLAYLQQLLRCFPSLLPAPPPTSTSAHGGRVAPAAPATTLPAPHALPRPSARLAACSAPLPMLQTLEISKCPKLTSLPDGVHRLPRLERITLEDCIALGSPEEWVSLTVPVALPPSTTVISLSSVFLEALYLPPSFLSLTRLTHLNLQELLCLQALFAPPHGAPPEDLLGDWEAGTQTDPIFGFRIDPHPGPPASLALLSSLQHLAIVRSGLPSLPSNLSELRSLKALIVEDCVAMPSLPASLAHLSNLEKLMLTTLPQLAHLPRNLGQLKALKEVTVEFCDALTGLPASIGLLSSLVLLSVTECKKFSSLPASIGSLPRLASLKLNCLPRLRRLPESLSLLPALVILSLEDCEQLQALPEGLAGVGTLREVIVAGCCELKHVPQSLLERQNVVDLQLSALRALRALNARLARPLPLLRPPPARRVAPPLLLVASPPLLLPVAFASPSPARRVASLPPARSVASPPPARRVRLPFPRPSRRLPSSCPSRSPPLPLPVASPPLLLPVAFASPSPARRVASLPPARRVALPSAPSHRRQPPPRPCPTVAPSSPPLLTVAHPPPHPFLPSRTLLPALS
ncbi:unnamed protein product [Closterium sp. Naga37s-1]|nr:unnamed protein product [Closterium sp. Naga37s-1]